jgi:hypothetical protein
MLFDLPDTGVDPEDEGQPTAARKAAMFFGLPNTDTDIDDEEGWAHILGFCDAAARSLEELRRVTSRNGLGSWAYPGGDRGARQDVLGRAAGEQVAESDAVTSANAEGEIS